VSDFEWPPHQVIGFSFSFNMNSTELFSIENNTVEISQRPYDLRKVDLPILYDGICYKVNVVALKKNAKRLLKRNSKVFHVDITSLLPEPLPSELFSPSLIAYSVVGLTARHVDGAMDGTILTLLEGRKEWVCHSPSGDKVYRITQNEQQTVYLPPGFSHEVTTPTVTSLAYGAMLRASYDERIRVLCASRVFLRSPAIGAEARESLLHDLEDVLPQKLTATRRRGKGPTYSQMLQIAGRENAIIKGGHTRRYKNGRLIKRKGKMTRKKKSILRCKEEEEGEDEEEGEGDKEEENK
jgi:hypothetical protein